MISSLVEMKRNSTGEPKHNEIATSSAAPYLPDGPAENNNSSSALLTSDIKISLQVDFASEENASMVYTALSVDKELQPDKVKRDMVLSGHHLTVNFAALEARFLRASFSAFMDVLVLATKTLEQFGSN